jgi:hypothetical protein
VFFRCYCRDSATLRPMADWKKHTFKILNLNPTKQMMTLICSGLGFLIGIVVGIVIQSENGPDREDFE